MMLLAHYEQLHLLWKAQKSKSDEEEHSDKNSELVQLLRQKNASLLEENTSKNDIIKTLSENVSIVNRICVMQIRSQKKYIKQLRENLQQKVMKNWEMK